MATEEREETLHFNLHVLAPPEAASYAQLLAEVLETMEPKHCLRIAQQVHFVFMPIGQVADLL